MKYRLLALLLALVLSLGMLTACGSTGTTSESPAQTSESPDATPAVETEEPEVMSSESAPAGESEIVPSEPPASEEPAPEEPVTTKLSDELVTLTYWQAWPPFLSSISEPQDAAMFAELEEILNVRLEITAVDTETSAEKLSLMCASGDMTDMIQGMRNYSGGSTKALDDEVIIDLLPLIEEYAPNYWSIMQSDDNIYKKLYQ